MGFLAIVLQQNIFLLRIGTPQGSDHGDWLFTNTNRKKVRSECNVTTDTHVKHSYHNITDLSQ